MSVADTTRDRIAFLRRLRAVRDFRPDPVPGHVVDDLLEVARWSGSTRNLQPWKYAVIRRSSHGLRPSVCLTQSGARDARMPW